MIPRSFRRVLLTTIVGFGLLLPMSSISADTVGTVRLCHTRAQQAITIEVGGPAVAAHLAHGDVLGGCDEINVCPFDAVSISLTNSEPRAVPVEITAEGQDLYFVADDPPGVMWALAETDGTPVVGPEGNDDYIRLLWYGFSEPGLYQMVFWSDLAGTAEYPSIDVSLSCADVNPG